MSNAEAAIYDYMMVMRASSRSMRNCAERDAILALEEAVAPLIWSLLFQSLVSSPHKLLVLHGAVCNPWVLMELLCTIRNVEPSISDEARGRFYPVVLAILSASWREGDEPEFPT